MISVVLDTNTIISAVFWPQSTARRCLAGLARRWYALAVSSEVFTEYEAIAAEFQPRFPTCNSAGALAWLRLKAIWVEPAPLGKRRSRDAKDDPFLACALATRAQFVGKISHAFPRRLPSIGYGRDDPWRGHTCAGCLLV